MKPCQNSLPLLPPPASSFGKGGGGGDPTYLPLPLFQTPTPQLTLADDPHIFYFFFSLLPWMRISWLRVQVQENQTPDSSAIKHCCETDNPANRQPRHISRAAHAGTASCSTPPAPPPNPPPVNQHILSFDSNRGELPRKKFAL